MPFDEPGRVVDLPKDEQRLTEVLDGVEGAHLLEFSLSMRIMRSAQPLPSGARTKAGELSMPREASSWQKASDMS